MKILLVEDEPKVGRFIQRGFTEVAYACVWVRTIAEAEEAHAEGPHDVIILDLGLPDGDGLDLLRRWRACGFNEPVLILSARGDRADRVEGLNLGADDYLAKPFGFEELLARVRSLLRRRDTAKASVLTHKGLSMNLEAHAATLGGVPMTLTNREFALLELLLRNKGRTVTRTQLAERVWEAHHDMETNLIEVYVRKLRVKFEGVPGAPEIRTLRGVGYSLE
jgi:DNA-binding response OmpR family regulator